MTIANRTTLYMLVFFILTSLTLEPVYATDRIFYVEFGDSRCPHCSNLNRFFEEHFPSQHYFCDASTNGVCKSMLQQLRGSGLPPYIPTTLVAYNESVVAVVIGEVTDESFWKKVVDEGLSLSNKTHIIVFLGTEPSGYIVVGNTTAFYNIFVSPFTASPTVTFGTSSTDLATSSSPLPLLLALALLAALILMKLFK